MVSRMESDSSKPEQNEAAPGPSKGSLAETLPALVFGRNPKRTLVRVGAMILVSFVALKFALTPIRVTGMSMYPGYQDGNVNFINRWSYARSKPKRGDVVGVWVPEMNAIFLKRIIGLPGERLALIGGWMMIDGEPLEEGYLHDPRDWTADIGLLGSDEYFVMGDNRSTSMNRHYYFVVKRGQILGKVLFDKTAKRE